MASLTTQQRAAIRHIHDEPGVPTIPAQTLRSLTKRGLTRYEKGVGTVLSTTGQAAYLRIMESGDGPEALKALLRFG